MKKVILSLLTIGGVAAVAIAGTQAFFSDTETSTGNLLQAGAIDLKIDNTSYRTSTQSGLLVASTETSWTLKDLTVEKFFNFTDLKPGDVGEDTISIHVNDNDAWACAHVDITENAENGVTEPEEDLNDTEPEGELGNELNFAFWADDGDNVFEVGETIAVQGPASNVLDGGTLALAQPAGGLFGNTPLTGTKTHYIGKFYCYGTFEPAPKDQDNVNTGTPLTRGGTGFTCDGSGVGNISQSDRLVGDISFYAVQSRNNPQFSCDRVVWPTPESEEDKIGALLSAYDQSTSCHVTVTDGGAEPNTIAEGIANASAGQTVCVDPGTYDENVVVNKSITLSGDGASATSTINGQGGGQNSAVTIAANNVVFEGFNVLGSGISAIWLNTGVSGATVRYNKFTSAAGMTALTTQGQVGNSTFLQNEFVGNGASQLAYVNGLASLGLGQDSDSIDFHNNTFSGTIVAGGEVLGVESTSSDVLRNVFESSLTSTYAIAEAWTSSVVFHENNFNGVGGVKVRNSNGGTVNAENNWWGAAVPAGHIFGSVDDDLKAAVAFPEN